MPLVSGPSRLVPRDDLCCTRDSCPPQAWAARLAASPTSARCPGGPTCPGHGTLAHALTEGRWGWGGTHEPVSSELGCHPILGLRQFLML